MCIIVPCSTVILRIDALSSAFYFPLDFPILYNTFGVKSPTAAPLTCGIRYAATVTTRRQYNNVFILFCVYDRFAVCSIHENHKQ